MIKLKSNFEIEKIRTASNILKQARSKIKKMIKPGITTNMIDKVFVSVVKKHKAKCSFLGYQGFPKSICASNNETLIHGIPNNKPLQDGDLLSIDMGVEWEGYHTDSAFTISVGKSSPENELLIKVAKESFYSGFDAIKKGSRVGDISAAIGKVIRKYHMFSTEDFAGHGVGEDLHEDPYIFNYGVKNTGPLLRPGMVIAIEPMILQTSEDVIVLKDGWTVNSIHNKKSSHYEHTVVINEDGTGEILT